MLDGDIEALRCGVPGRGVWFAGEHTAPFVALGTVTGAYWSGEKVAGRILWAYGVLGEGEGEGDVVVESGGEGLSGVGEGKGKGTSLGAGLVGV